MDLRNGEPYGVIGYVPGIRTLPPKRENVPTNRYGRDSRGLGPTFEACAELFERCSDEHNGCEHCPFRQDGCMSLWESICFKATAPKKAGKGKMTRGQLSMRDVPRVKNQLDAMSSQLRRYPERR